MSDYQHPVAYPLFMVAVGVIIGAAQIDDALAGDWVSVALLVGSIAMVVLVARDLFLRWRRRQR